MYEIGVLLGLWAAVYVVTVLLYFGQGGLMIWLSPTKLPLRPSCYA